MARADGDTFYYRLLLDELAENVYLGASLDNAAMQEWMSDVGGAAYLLLDVVGLLCGDAFRTWSVEQLPGEPPRGATVLQAQHYWSGDDAPPLHGKADERDEPPKKRARE